MHNPNKWNHLIPRSFVAHCRTVRPGVAEILRATGAWLRLTSRESKNLSKINTMLGLTLLKM